MSFQFVDNNSAIDPTARRRIRSHAATGKNTGKKITRRSRKSTLNSKCETTTPFRVPEVISKRHTPTSQSLIPTIDLQIGDGLSTLFLPSPVAPERRDAVKKAISFFSGLSFTPELHRAFEKGNSCSSGGCLQLIFIDEAFFNIAMAASMAILNLITSTRDDPDIETHHVSQTLRLVNQRLSSADATSDATIAVVVIIGQYHRHRGQYRDGLVHMNGLKRMVEMRGGISPILRESPMLGSKIIRLDLEYAVEWGSEPIFSTEEIMPASTAGPWLHERLSLEYSHRRPGLLQYRDLRSPELRSIATEMTTLAWLHNDAIAADRPKLTMRQSHEALLLIGYRLVHFSPLAGRRLAGDFEDAVHLGLVMFMVPFLHRLGGGIQDCPLLYELARSAAFSRFGVENREVLLWMLFVGRASVFTPRDEWLVSMVGRVLYDLSLYSWEEVLEVLGRFPWVGVLFDKAGKSLYDAATSVSETTG